MTPERIVAEALRTENVEDKLQPRLPQLSLPHLDMPAHHDVRAENISHRRLYGNIVAAIKCGPENFSELLLTPGVGARTVRALAMVAEVIHGAPHRFSDPARFTLALGGKDRHPFPVPIKVYDETIRVLKDAVCKAHLGHSEELSAIKRLDEQSRQLEQHIIKGPEVSEIIAHETEMSRHYGGRSVFGIEE